MARPIKKRGKIRIKQRALIQKKDKTNVARPDTTKYPRKEARPPADTGVTFRVKIKKKQQ